MYVWSDKTRIVARWYIIEASATNICTYKKRAYIEFYKDGFFDIIDNCGNGYNTNNGKWSIKRKKNEITLEFIPSNGYGYGKVLNDGIYKFKDSKLIIKGVLYNKDSRNSSYYYLELKVVTQRMRLQMIRDFLE